MKQSDRLRRISAYEQADRLADLSRTVISCMVVGGLLWIIAVCLTA